MKRIDKAGKSYRIRRGKLVEIPAEWVGKFPTDKTKRQRPSRMTNKLRRRLKTINGLDYADRNVNVDEESVCSDGWDE